MSAKLAIYLLAGLALVGLFAAASHTIKKASRAEAAELALETTKAAHTAYVERTVKALEEFTRQAQADRASDTALTARITALEGVAADLRRAARALPATTEKPNAQGVVTTRINADWGLCYFAFLSGDPTDSAACQARAAVNADLQIGEHPRSLQVPP